MCKYKTYQSIIEMIIVEEGVVEYWNAGVMEEWKELVYSVAKFFQPACC